MKLSGKILVLFVAAAAPVWAEPPRQGPQYGPWNHDLAAYESKDGVHFESKGIFMERAGVPDFAAAPDGALYAAFQWFPKNTDAFDRIAVMRSRDGGRSWSKPQTVSIYGMPENIFRSFDPALAVLKDGTFRLYFAAERVTASRPRGNRAVFSAVSRDGIHFEFEPGQRFGFENIETYDPSVIFFKGRWHLFCPAPADGTAFHAVSEDGLNFKQLDDVRIPERRTTWIGNPLSVREGLRFFGSGRGGIWSAVSEEGNLWKMVSMSGLSGGDAAAAELPGGRILVVTAGALREDAVPGTAENFLAAET